MYICINSVMYFLDEATRYKINKDIRKRIVLDFLFFFFFLNNTLRSFSIKIKNNL